MKFTKFDYLSAVFIVIAITAVASSSILLKNDKLQPDFLISQPFKCKVGNKCNCIA